MTVNNYSFGAGLIMLVVSLCFWVLVGLYLDAVLPKTYGDRLPVFFCCMRKYWCEITKDKKMKRDLTIQSKLREKVLLKITIEGKL